MSKLFSKVRKEDKEKQPVEEGEQQESNNKQQLQQIQQNFDSISAQMDALQLQDYQNMALDQFERLVIVGMCNLVKYCFWDCIRALHIFD